MSNDPWEDLRNRLLSDPDLREGFAKRVGELRGEEIDLEDPPGWFEDALSNFANWLIERFKDLINAYQKYVVPAFEGLSRDVIDHVLEYIDPEEKPTRETALVAASRFLSYSAAASFQAILMSFASQVIPFVNLSALNRLVDWLYWGLGMGFMGWQIIAPATRQAILNPLEEYYNLKFRSRRIPRSVVLRLYRQGIITKEQAVEQLAIDGWKEEIIEELIEAEEQRRKEPIALERPAPWARAGRAYALGKITREAFVRILQTHRFDEQAINIIVSTFDRDREEEIAVSP